MTDSQKRSYLWGQLWSIVYRWGKKTGTMNLSYAEQNFTKHPHRTWEKIERTLVRTSNTEQVLQDIADIAEKFTLTMWQDNSPLEGMFALGFHTN